jgi:hypothetical protein
MQNNNRRVKLTTHNSSNYYYYLKYTLSILFLQDFLRNLLINSSFIFLKSLFFKLNLQLPFHEVNNFSNNPQYLHVLRNKKSYYHLQDNSTFFPVLNQVKKNFITPSYFSKFNFNTIIPSTLRSSKWFSVTYPH